MEEAWIKAWKELPQTQIQAWIERIRLEGGNEYAEGREAFRRDWAGTRIKVKLSYLQPQGKEEGRCCD